VPLLAAVRRAAPRTATPVPTRHPRPTPCRNMRDAALEKALAKATADDKRKRH
jgi:hypothetical protein